MSITEEVATLEREGSQVLVVAPDAASATAIGLNPQDPATRQPSARAGRAQGRELADSVAALWSQIEKAHDHAGCGSERPGA